MQFSFRNILGISAVVVSLGTVAQADTLSFATGGQGGSWYGIGAGLAEVLGKEGVDVSVEIGGGMSNIVSVATGDSAIGMTNGFAVPMAEMGEAPFPAPVSGVTALGVFMISTVQVPVLESSGVATFEELKGKDTCLLPLSASSTIAFQKILAGYDMTEEDTNLSRGNLGYCVDQMKDRKVIATSAATAMPTGSFSELAASLPVRFLPVSDAAFDKIVADNPAFVRVTMPAGTYTGLDAPIETVGTQALLIAGPSLSEDDGYAIVKALVDHIGDVRKIHSGMADMTAESLANVAGLDLHPGAARYFREAGLIE